MHLYIVVSWKLLFKPEHMLAKLGHRVFVCPVILGDVQNDGFGVKMDIAL